MNAIEFSNGEDRVTISWDFDGDYVVVIETRVDGFHGHADGHVVSGEFKAFAKNIATLAESRQGQATFSSAHPGLFEVTVRSVDAVGHLGVFGTLTYQSDTSIDVGQTLQFSLHFEPSQIEGAAGTLIKLTA